MTRKWGKETPEQKRERERTKRDWEYDRKRESARRAREEREAIDKVKRDWEEERKEKKKDKPKKEAVPKKKLDTNFLKYKNKSGNSSVVGYKINSDSIEISFGSAIYRYNNNSAGHSIIETMKQLAQSGRGLNSFINSVKPKYYSKS